MKQTKLNNIETKNNNSSVVNICKEYSFFNTVNCIIFVLDTQGGIIKMNNTAYKRLNYVKEELNEKSVPFVIPENKWEEVSKFISSMYPGKVGFYNVPLITKQGILLNVQTRIVMGQWNGTPASLFITSDLIENELLEEDKEKSRSRLIAAQAMTHMGNWELDLDTRDICASEEAFNIYGIEYSLRKLSLEFVQKCVFPEYRELLNITFRGLIEKKVEYDLEYKIRNHKTGEEHYVHSKAVLLTDTRGNASKVFGTIQDITQSKKKEMQSFYLSYHDQLTGLYSRRFYEEQLTRLNTQRNLPMTIVMGDVNGLKLINDSFGHVMGDALLKKVAKVLSMACRTDDIIARLGGDEFVILLPKTDAYGAEKIIKRINDLSLCEKVGPIDISISFGYETKNSEEEKIQEIFKNAEDHMYKKKLFEGPSMRGRSIKTIMNTLHEKNKREEQHSQRVSKLCVGMGEALGMSEYENEELKLVGLLHDIGKIAIDETIIDKQGKLTKDEWKEIKRHCGIGYRILNSVNDMSAMANYVLYHHERWDGKGYPKGLKGDEIPFVSRIIAIADAYDAMTNERSYSSLLPKEVAIKELQKNAGVQFDPELVKIFIKKVVR